MSSFPTRTPYFAEYCSECDREFNGYTLEFDHEDKVFCSERCWKSWTSYICPNCTSSPCACEDDAEDRDDHEYHEEPMAGFVTPTPEELLRDYDPDDYDYCAECERLQKAEESLPCPKCRNAILFPNLF